MRPTVYVSKNIVGELTRRPDSLKAELLNHCARAIGIVNKIKPAIVDFLRSLPQGAPMTLEQRELPSSQ